MKQANIFRLGCVCLSAIAFAFSSCSGLSEIEARAAADKNIARVESQFKCHLSPRTFTTGSLATNFSYTYFVEARGSECEEALTELNRRSASADTDFVRMKDIRLESEVNGRDSILNQDLIHELDPKDDT